MSNILSFLDASQQEWDSLVDRAVTHYSRGSVWSDAARGRSLGLLFMNSSLRTRTSMELAAAQLGAHVTTLVSGSGVWEFEWERGVVMDGGMAEHISEAVGVLSRYYDGLGLRAFAGMTNYTDDRMDVRMKQFAKLATVPVVNLESAWYHPCQAVADASALRIALEDRGTNKFVLSWAYHPRALPMAVPNSALLMAAREGFDVTIASPETHRLDPSIVAAATASARANGGSVTESGSQQDAATDAVVVYAKAWGGKDLYQDVELEKAQRAANKDWRVTAALMARTRNARFMHCLPVRRNVVVDDAVLDGANAIHLLQAEMRLFGQKAILERMWDL